MEELKECPFCGGEAELKQHKSAIDKNDRPIGGWFVDCEECDCGTPWHNTESQAITAWNRRTTPENKPLTLEQLRQMDGEPVYVDKEQQYRLVEVSRDPQNVFTRLCTVYNCVNAKSVLDDGCCIYARKPEQEEQNG